MAYIYGYGSGYGGGGYGLTSLDPLAGWGDDIDDWQSSGGSGYGLISRDPLAGWGDDIDDWQSSGGSGSGFGDALLSIINGPTAAAIVQGIFGSRSSTSDEDEDTKDDSGQQQGWGMGGAVLYGVAGLTGLLVLVQIFDALDS